MVVLLGAYYLPLLQQGFSFSVIYKFQDAKSKVGTVARYSMMNYFEPLTTFKIRVIGRNEKTPSFLDVLTMVGSTY